MIWLVGNKGMLGSDVEAQLKDTKSDYVATDKELDVTIESDIAQFINNKNIDFIINCAAYTAVDNAEDDVDLAYEINAKAVENLALAAKKLDAVLIHISTDYVFSGDKSGEYFENDKTDPKSIYGKSKLAGEENILKNIDKHFILRTAWLYGLNGKNFVYTMINLFKARKEVNIVNDQFGSPTFSADLAKAILEIIKVNSNKYGIYNFTNEGKTNWAGFAKEILKISIREKIVENNVLINEVSSKEFVAKAARPKNSYLSKEKIKTNFGLKINSWQNALEQFLKQAILNNKI